MTCVRELAYRKVALAAQDHFLAIRILGCAEILEGRLTEWLNSILHWKES
eukprot:CAMPEP_0180511658 /NCGR_PEP_ID=MMETSP1036_2-20121128/51145_1 /TAXON_ID=632150 /ORGANISM="Azadinium spinosum, Strain 3D9" /LENGTH=49 /DNA_ID= /DNA_START= /DNA_END= /DNA_ORIENTATION=